MTDGKQLKTMQGCWVTFCKWSLTVCTTVVLLSGIVLVYAGVGAARIQCTNKNTYAVQYYHWKCDAYYIPDFVYVSIETGLVMFTGLLLALGQKKMLRLPILAFLTIMTVFMVMGIQKYGKEYPERGLFLKPKTGERNDNYDYNRIFVLDTDDSDYNSYGSSNKVKKFEITELKGISTRKAPRKVVICGYSFIVAGNLVLLLVVGTGKIPSAALPSLGKYKKTVDRFRSHLAAMIAPGTKPLSDDEEDEKLVQREMEPV